MKARSIFLLVLILLLLAACGGKAETPAVKPAAESAGQVEVTPVKEQQADPAGPAATEPASIEPVAPSGGPGSFDLSAPEAGLEQLASYRAVLEMTFDGTQQGQPFRQQRAYVLETNRAQDARLLTETSTGPEGAPSVFFAGQVGPVRYGQPAQDAACQANLAAQDAGQQLEPAMLLPRLIGAESAGEETVGGIDTQVYQFDQRALGVGDEAAASGKVWIAQEGGWVVKYELSLESDTVFGEGITGRQIWLYALGDVNVAAAQLPESCPLPLAELPVPPDAQGVARLPDSVQFQTGLSPEALEAFYAEQMPVIGWAANDTPPASEGQWRWVFTRPASQGQTVAMISARAADGGLQVRIYQVQTEVGVEQ